MRWHIAENAHNLYDLRQTCLHALCHPGMDNAVIGNHQRAGATEPNYF
jgi:hypothetical protein